MSPPVPGTVAEALVGAAERWPEEVGWVFDDTALTRQQMHSEVDRVAAALIAHGIGTGDRIAAWLPNRTEWAQLLFACARIGAVLVSLNTRWKSTEAGFVLGHSRASMLFMLRRFRSIDFAELLADLDWPEGSGPASAIHVVEVDGEQVPGATSWKQFVADGDTLPSTAVAERSQAVHADDPLLLQYTSGSTSRPKGAVVPHRVVLNYGVEVVDRLGVQPGEAYLNPQPLYHVAGSCVALSVPLSRRIRSVMPSHYDVRQVLELTAREQCVARGGTPTMYLDELAHPDFSHYDTSSMRSAWVGAPPTVLDRIRAEYPIEGLVNLYAATEGGGTWGASSDPWEIRRLTTGKPLTGTEIHIRDVDTHAELPAGEIGEIGFRGWNQILEYAGEPERTAEAFDSDGYLHIGDLGMLDEAGHLHYTGRIKDMIRNGGENVAAEEVESFIAEHPLVRQVSVIGRPDDRMGEVVVAVVEPTEPASITEAELIEYCRARLAGFRTPKAVHFVEQWPTTSSGKIHKPALKERFA